MTHPYHEILKYEGDTWEEFLDRIQLIEVFKPVIDAYPERQLLKCVIRYIVYAYSANSEQVILGMDWHENKKRIFEYVLAKPMKDSYEDLVLLKNGAVVDSIHRWLDIQDSDTFKQLSVLKDLRTEMQLSANSKIIKSSGEVDYDQKFKNADYAMKLKSMIKNLEQELIQNNQKLKDAVKEVKTASNKAKVNIGPETFSK